MLPLEMRGPGIQPHNRIQGPSPQYKGPTPQVCGHSQVVNNAMDPEIMAEAIAALVQGMHKGSYLVFCEAVAQAGGEVVIPVDVLERDAHRLPPRTEITAEARGIVIRLAS